MKTIRDAVHGDMQFDAVETALVDTAPFQRLRGIKQLGTSSLVFPSAVHTRFEHSLGTCWLAKRLLDALERAGETLEPHERSTAALAALLHDITHVPFGHTFEDERRLLERHDEDCTRLEYFLHTGPIARILESTGAADAVRAVLAGGDVDRPFVRQLVTGTVCADLLDYLRRDALHCGLALGYDERLFHYFGLADGRLVVRLHKHGFFRRDALSELIHLLQIRYSLTERVYYHHAKVVAGAMVSRALELALAARRLAPVDLLSLRDDSFLDRLAQGTDVSGLSDLLDDLAQRRLYKRVYLLTMQGCGRPGLSPAERDSLAERYHFDIEARGRLERQLAGALAIPEAHLIVYCPSPKMALKEADVPVEVAPGVVRPLSELGHPDVEALSQKHRALWRFYVCMRRDHADRFSAAGRAAEELLGHPNQLQPQSQGRLALPGS